MSEKILCSVYRSSKKDEMYVYVERARGLKDLPDALMSGFGAPVHVFDVLLTADRKLARVDVQDVMTKVREVGFFLQMPPPEDELLDRKPLDF